MPDASRRVAVIGCDMNQNALARSWILADMLRHAGWDPQLAGPLLQGAVWEPRREVWEPLRGALPEVQTFDSRGMPDFIRKAVAFVEANPHDVVLVSKLRFTSMLMGLLYKRRWNAKVIVDADDFEMGLMGVKKPLHPSELEQASAVTLPWNPKHPLWTRLAEGMVDLADAMTVPGVSLQERYGGAIVRHSRDARLFDRALYDSDESRRRYGLPAKGRLVMFVGTPRIHKRVGDVLDFVKSSGEPDLMVCMTDHMSAHDRAALLAQSEGRLVLMPHVPFTEVPALLSAASFICLPLDETSPVAYYQVPAKLSDALALKIPLLMTPTAAVADLAGQGAWLNDGPLDAASFARAMAMSPAELTAAADRAYEIFLREFSHEAAGRVLDRTLREAGNKPLPGWSRHLLKVVDSLGAGE